MQEPGPGGAVVAERPESSPAAAHWWVLHTKSRQEKAVALALDAAGVRYRLPLIERVRVYRRSQRRVRTPLFPSYVFIDGSAEEAYAAAASERVARLIKVLDQGRLDQELANLTRVLEIDRTLDPFPYLQRGRRARVIGGPFKGVEGVVEDRPKPDRLILQIEALGRATSLQIDPSLLESAE